MVKQPFVATWRTRTSVVAWHPLRTHAPGVGVPLSAISVALCLASSVAWTDVPVWQLMPDWASVPPQVMIFVAGAPPVAEWSTVTAEGLFPARKLLPLQPAPPPQ